MLPSPEEDRAALIAAIEGEHAAFMRKDYAAWANHWLQVPSACHWGWVPTQGAYFMAGWQEISAAVKGWLDNSPEPEIETAQHRYRQFHVTADMALVVYDHILPREDRGFQDPGLKQEMKVLVRDHGRWLHLTVFSLQPEVEAARCPVVQVDATGRVLWQNDLAQERLFDHPKLVLRAGKLRARSRDADRALRSAIVWASGGLIGPAKRASKSRAGLTGNALPILTSEGGEGPAVMCWVQKIDGVIAITLDDPSEVGRRIAAASVIFGLSAAQQRLVQLLADGADLSGAARAMAVSVNTLRTQLRRVFDKTGVHSQAALLRLMLSIAPPLG